MDDLVVRATWRTTKRLMLHDIGYDAQAFARAGATREVPEKHRTFSKQLGENARSARDFIALAFTDRTSRQYPLTVAISEVHLRSDDILGVMYPSITRNGDCDNLALQPKFADVGLQLIDAEAIRIHRWNTTNPDGRGLADLAGVDPNGDLFWSYTGAEPTSLSQGEERRMFVKFGEELTCQNDADLIINGKRYILKPGFTIQSQPSGIVVRDAAGNIITPV
jgi:hypothetical protein